MPQRKGSSSIAAIPRAILAQLHVGTLETATLAEGLAIDLAVLLRNALPHLSEETYQYADTLKGLGITRRMEAIGVRLLQDLGLEGLPSLQEHASDTVRGWGCYVVGLAPTLKLKTRLELIKPFADDHHFGVREWAWMPMRRHLAENLSHAIAALKPWVRNPSPNLRRFAIESLRPRGVWTTQIKALIQNPETLLPLLEPLRSDESNYVQLSVANWLNDAAKSQPAWVKELCERWLHESPTVATRAICQRGQRSLRA